MAALMPGRSFYQVSDISEKGSPIPVSPVTSTFGITLNRQHISKLCPTSCPYLVCHKAQLVLEVDGIQDIHPQIRKLVQHFSLTRQQLFARPKFVYGRLHYLRGEHERSGLEF
jgi:hypothetical protein